MTTSCSRSVTPLVLLFILIGLTCASPAVADLYVVELNSTFISGGSASGWFTYDTASQNATAWSIEATLGPLVAFDEVRAMATDPYTFNPGPTSVQTETTNDGNRLFYFSSITSGGEPTDPYYWLNLGFGPGTLVPDQPFVFGVAYRVRWWFELDDIWASGSGGADTGSGSGVARVAPVPLPPAILLFGSGIIPLAWALRRKRGGA